MENEVWRENDMAIKIVRLGKKILFMSNDIHDLY